MELYIYGHAVKEFFRFRRVGIWIFLALFAFGLARAWPYLAPAAAPQDQYSAVAFIIVFRMLALASAIFTTAIISQEVEQKTIVYLLTRPVARWKLLLFRYLASVTVVAAVSCFAAILTSVAVYNGHFLSNPLLLRDLMALIVGAFAYGAVFLFVSLVFNRAMIICLLFAFGWETAVPNLPGDLYHLSIFSYLQTIAQHPSDAGNKGIGFLSGTLGTNLITLGTAVPAMALLIGVSVLLSLWWFTRFEYVPREDAE